jgi:predicted GH43/DUF377 family glycosyl hydrolase
MVCRLGDQFQVEAVWLPNYADRAPLEKNWQFFEHGRRLYSIYSVDPHVVLRHEGRHAERVAATGHGYRWPGQHLRGGAPPVRVGDEYYHWFHSMRREDGDHFHYELGVYTFAARPPFRLRRGTPAALLSVNPEENIPGWNKSVIFPCGAMFRDGQWIISYGQDDRECRIAEFAAADVEKSLITI